MIGVTHIIQRINNIETRFRQPASVMPQPYKDEARSFTEILERAETQSGNPPDSTTLNNSTSKNDIANLVKSTALKHGVNPKLALAVAKAESSLSADALSPVGAVGVMQLMPDTARTLGVKDIYNVEENIDGGVRYLRQMLNTFGGDVNKALAAYNAGPAAVQSYNGIPPYKETQEYVLRVNELAR